MRGRYGSADAVEAAKNQVPHIICKPNRPMDKGRNGARYFRNPPQPHMCIQDYIEETNEPCFINVLSWVKISTPRKPEDPIPLYGGMRVPHNSSAALSLSSHFGAKGQPVIFAVMANPEILRLSGKTAQDPSDRDALVELMIDFVEAMNPDVRFKRQFTVLRDRDLAGELKDIWLAVQAKRERERGENGKRELDKARENKDETWRDDLRQKGLQNVGQDVPNMLLSLHNQEEENGAVVTHKNYVSNQADANQIVDDQETGAVEGQYQEGGEISSLSLTTTMHLSTTPSIPQPNKENSQHIGAISYEEESVYSIIRSHYQQDYNRIDSNTIPNLNKSDHSSEKRFSGELTSSCVSSTNKEIVNNTIYPLFSSCVVNESQSSIGVTSVSQPVDERNVSLQSVHHDQIHCSSFIPKEDKLCLQSSDENYLLSNESSTSYMTNFPYDSLSHLKEEGVITQRKSGKSPSLISHEHNSNAAEELSFSEYTGGATFLINKSQVPNVAGRSHEDLLPGLSDSSGMKFPSGSEHNTVAIP